MTVVSVIVALMILIPVAVCVVGGAGMLLLVLGGAR